MKFTLLTACFIAVATTALLRVGNQRDAFLSAGESQSDLSGKILLCSGEPYHPGTCVGSAYCTACKNCKYCGHCNSGGSCGVCGKRAGRTPSPQYYPAPEKQYTPPSSTARSPGTDNYRTIEVEPPTPTAFPPATEKKVYTVSTATSLRQSADSQAVVLKRLAPGHALYLIDCSDRYWCKVTHLGRTGWVKKQLLVEQ